ncbi:MAG: hypothetical protein ABW202_17695 [Duganella sp.]
MFDTLWQVARSAPLQAAFHRNKKLKNSGIVLISGLNPPHSTGWLCQLKIGADKRSWFSD